MAQEQSALVGSGTIPFIRNILPSGSRGLAAIPSGQGGHRLGTQVIVANFEDMNSVDAWSAGDHSVSTTAVEIAGPLINPLNRNRTVRIQNTDASTAMFVGPTNGVTATNGFRVAAGETLELPLLNNASVWAITSAGTVDVRVIVY
jgi:hypothetical protein